MNKIYVILMFILLLTPSFSMAQESEYRLKRNEQATNFQKQNNKAYNYQEHDGIVAFYETSDKDLYRKLLPKEFDMPNRLLVHLFVMDFYKINSKAQPYKEVSISLLAKHDGKEVWHCIFMPVSSRHSMIAGQRALGLPKTIGNIQFKRDNQSFTGEVVDNQNRRVQFVLNTNNYKLSKAEEQSIKDLNSLPKISLLNGKAIQITRSGRQGNIIDASKHYPERIKVQGGRANISFDHKSIGKAHPFDLKAVKIIASYYIHNKIPFRLGRK